MGNIWSDGIMTGSQWGHAPAVRFRPLVHCRGRAAAIVPSPRRRRARHTRLTSTKRFINLKVNLTIMYCKVASSRLSRLVAHPRIFIRRIKGKFDPYVLWPLAFGLWPLNSRPVYCSRLYGIYFLRFGDLKKFHCTFWKKPPLEITVTILAFYNLFSTLM